QDLNAAVSADGQYGDFSGSMDASFSSSVHITQEDTSIYAQSFVTSVEEAVEGSHLNTDTSNLGIFRSNCGTHYVTAIIYGGELVALLQAADRSEEDRAKFDAHVTAALIGVGSGHGDVTQSAKTLRTHEDLRIEVSKSGAPGNLPTTPED